MDRPLMLLMLPGVSPDLAEVRLGEVASGIGLGAIVAVPTALLGGILSAQTRVESESWLAGLVGSLGRLPTLLMAILLGTMAVSAGFRESPRLWGGVATLAGIPVIWRIVTRSLSELPAGIVESAAALGCSRVQTLWLTGFPVVGPTLVGAVCVGAARALTVGWVVSELRLRSGGIELRAWLDLAVWVVLVTVAGTLLLAAGRRRSRALERASL